MNSSRWIAAGAVLLCLLAGTKASAQTLSVAPPENVLQLSATATVEAQQDMLSMTLSTTREGSDAATVQTELRSALDAAMTEARKNAQPGQLDVRSGSFNLSPRYGRDGKMNGWRGTASLVLEGKDIPRITQTASRIGSLSVASIGFGLSREQQAKSETEAQGQAIDNFKQRADELAKRFGFSGYSLREVAVNSHQGGIIQPRMMAMEAAPAMAASAPLPVEPGKASVVVNVSGSVQLK